MSVYSVNCFRLSAIAFYDKIVSVTDDDRMQDFKREKQEAGTVQVKLCSFFEAVQVYLTGSYIKVSTTVHSD